MCSLSANITDYYYVSQGKTTIPNVDDGEECLATDVSGQSAAVEYLKCTLFSFIIIIISRTAQQCVANFSFLRILTLHTSKRTILVYRLFPIEIPNKCNITSQTRRRS